MTSFVLTDRLPPSVTSELADRIVRDARCLCAAEPYKGFCFVRVHLGNGGLEPGYSLLLLEVEESVYALVELSAMGLSRDTPVSYGLHPGSGEVLAVAEWKSDEAAAAPARSCR